MKVSIRNQETDILVSTVLLHKQTTKLTLFHCYKCGSAIAQVQGDITAIFSGLMPTPDAVVIKRCNKCSENYTFQSGKQAKITKLTLSSSEFITTFHCAICRTQLLQYTKDYIRELPSGMITMLPHPFQCFKPDCEKSYILQDIVSVV